MGVEWGIRTLMIDKLKRTGRLWERNMIYLIAIKGKY